MKEDVGNGARGESMIASSSAEDADLLGTGIVSDIDDVVVSERLPGQEEATGETTGEYDDNPVKVAYDGKRVAYINTPNGDVTKDILIQYVEKNVTDEIESVLRKKSAGPPMVGIGVS
jgi:hypothetical protein